MSALPEIPQDRPFLAWTRKYGWMVAVPVPARAWPMPVALSRPGRVRLLRDDILAVADLPPVPSEAL